MTVTRPASSPPCIGIIMLDTAFPRLVGDVGNPRTFPFPVRYETVSGASPERVVKRADPGLLRPFLQAAGRLETRGAKALATSCGFLAIFQQELARSVNIPVFSSSLLQIHLARAIIKKEQDVGIITADSNSLGPQHFAGLGITRPPQAIIGLQEAEEFPAVFLGNRPRLERRKLEQDMSLACDELMRRFPGIGAVVLECTNMPPFAPIIRQKTCLPVFDVVSLIHYAYAVVSG